MHLPSTPSRPHGRRKLAALTVCAALIAAACGSGEGDVSSGPVTVGEPAATQGETPTTPPAPSDSGVPQTAAPQPAESGEPAATEAPAPVASDLPNVDVLDVYTGETVNLTSLAPAGTPLLLWFYAPH